MFLWVSLQESFINISVPKIDKDYSLYRTYVIFRTLGLRHLVVVDVHNHVVGLITRKDVMPFKMQERLESLLDQTTTLNPDIEFGPFKVMHDSFSIIVVSVFYWLARSAEL